VSATPPAPAAPASFGALRIRDYRIFLGGSILAMMADNIDHVISYWVLWDKFHSPSLGGFAVVSHWLPFLFFSIYSGALADRFDPRRMVQIGMGIFMLVSCAWAYLFFTDTLQTWHAVVLLTVHGFAGVFWSPPSQVLLFDIVGPAHLQSAVRLSATGRWLGQLMGPAVGAAMMMAFAPPLGILLNALIYLPLLWWLRKAPYGPRFRKDKTTPPPPLRTFADIRKVLGEIARHRTIVTMSLLAGSASLLIGKAYHAQMPGYAHDLGQGHADMTYSLLLAADAAGALTAGVVLESRNWLRPNSTTAIALAAGWCLCLASFALTRSYAAALLILFAAGFFELSFNSMAQTLVQLEAPKAMRGAVIGLFTTCSLGLRAFSGVSVGVLGAAVGIHWSLAASAMLLLTVTIALLGFSVRARAR
jgi:MFS family permease